MSDTIILVTTFNLVTLAIINYFGALTLSTASVSILASTVILLRECYKESQDQTEKEKKSCGRTSGKTLEKASA